MKSRKSNKGNVLGLAAIVILIMMLIPEGHDKNIKDEKAPLDKFFVDFTENGNYDNVKEIAKKYGLFINDRSSVGVGRGVVNIASTKKTSKAVGSKSFTFAFADEYYYETGDYFITINTDTLDNIIESVEYVNNVDYIIGKYSNKDGYSIRDLNRSTPVRYVQNDDGTETASAVLPVDTAQDVIDYVPVEETEISPLEEFYCSLRILMTYQDVINQINDNGFYKTGYLRHGSYVTFAKDIESRAYGTVMYINFDDYDFLSELEFWDYVVYRKEGIYLRYISDLYDPDECTQGNGYYVIGAEENKKFDDAHEAIQYLHSFR